MKFQRILCLFSMILVCTDIGNCRNLPQTNNELVALYKTKNNGLTEDDIVGFLKEAIKLNKRDMVKTIMNPPLQERVVGDKNNPKVTQEGIKEIIKEIYKLRLPLRGFDGYLEATGEKTTTQENINSAFIKFSNEFVSIYKEGKRLQAQDDEYEYDSDYVKIIDLRAHQGIKPDQETMNTVFLLAVENNIAEMYNLLLQQEIKPNQEAMNSAFITAVERSNMEIFTLLLQQDVKPDPETMRTALTKAVGGIFTQLLQQGIKPDQETMNSAFVTAVENGNQEMFELLLQQDVKPDQEAMNKAFIKAVEKNNRAVMKNNSNQKMLTLLLQQEIKPDQETMNQAFIAAAKSNNKKMFTLLLQQEIKPDQETIKKAFVEAVKEDSVPRFTELASLLDPQDILAATKVAGRQGSVAVLRKILDEYSPGADVVSEALTATATKIAKTEKDSRQFLRQCCEVLLNNKKHPPSEESVTTAREKGCLKKK